MTFPFTLTLMNDGQRLALFADIAVKGLLVLLAAAGIAIVLRRSSAAARHLIGSIAVISLLFLPVMEIALPKWKMAIIPAIRSLSLKQMASDRVINAGIDEHQPDRVEPPVPSTEPPAIQSNSEWKPKDAEEVLMATETKAPLLSSEKPGAGARSNWGLALLVIWAAGAVFILARLLIATLSVRSIAARAELLDQEEWLAPARASAERLGFSRRFTLLESSELSMPIAWGVLRPIVLIPVASRGWSAERRAIVLLHELSHIKRGDCLIQMLAQAACALHWYNPLVWFAARRLRIEREIACDNEVLEAGTRPTDYATHLVGIARSFEPGVLVPLITVGMACSQLHSRVRSILSPTVPRRSLNRARVSLVCLLAGLVVVPLSMARPSPVNASEPAPETPGFDALNQSGGPLTAKEVGQSIASNSNQPQIRTELIKKALMNAVPDRSDTTELPLVSDDDQDIHKSHVKSHVDGMGHGEGMGTGAGSQEHSGHGEGTGSGVGEGQGSGKGSSQDKDSRDASIDPAKSGELNSHEIHRLRLHGITPDFIEEVQKMGFDRASIDQVIQLHLHGIDEAFVKQAHSWGYDKASINEIVHLKISGITTDYINAMIKEGYAQAPVQRLALLKMNGVTPEYVQSIRRAGYDKVPLNELANMKSLGITESFIREARSWAPGDLTVRDLIHIKVFNVNPVYIAEMRTAGFNGLSLSTLVLLKERGIGPDFVKQMRELGIDNLTTDQLVEMAAVGINPAYVKKLRAAGFKNVPINRMIEMKRTGIDEILLKNAR